MVLPSNYRNRVWNPALKGAGLSGVRVHDMRHTAASIWIAAGATPNLVAQRLGHADVAYALSTYGHLFDGADRQFAENLKAPSLID